MSSKTDIITDDYKEKYGFSDPIEAYAVKGTQGLSERVVQEIVRLHDEPAWMEQIRMKALKHFLDMKPPAWAPDLADIDFQSFTYYARPTDKAAGSWEELPEYIKRTYDKLGITEAEKKFLAGVGAVYECLSPDSKVFTTRGLVPISEIEAGYMVFSWDQNTERLIQAPVKSKSYKGKRPVFAVRTENDTIMATENHPFLVLSHVLPPGRKRRGFWFKEWRYLSELKAGDLLVIPKALPMAGNPHPMIQPEVYTTTVGHNQYGAAYALDVSHLYNDVSLPGASTPDLLWILGLYIGDGIVHSSVRESGRTRSRIEFMITSKEPELRDTLIRVGETTLGLQATFSDSVVTFNSTILASYFRLNGFQSGAKEKSVPDWVFTLPRAQLLSFLAGVVDSDGYARAKNNCLNITSRNRRLIDQLRDLCRICGFPVSKVSSFKGQDKNGATTNYRFYIYGRFEDIPCRNPQRTSRFWIRKFIHNQNGTKGLKLGKYLNEDIGVTRIISIQPAGDDDVYDIEINGPHNFVAEGLIVHNSEAVYHSIQGELEKKGVVFTDTVTALKEYPDIMKKYFGTVVPFQDNYIAALQTAVWSAGSFVYVPEGVKVPMILQAYFRINERKMGQFERTLIVAEPYSEVSYNEGCLPAGELVSKGHAFERIEALGLKEMVLTHEGSRQEVTHRYIHPHNGQMLTIVPQSAASAFRLTPEHPVLAVKRARVSKRRSRKGWLPEASTAKLMVASPEFIEAGKLEVGDFIVYVAPTEEEDDPSLTDALLKILGLYLAEGVVSYNTKLRLDYLSFSFGESESEKRLAYELVELIHSIGENASVQRNRGRYYTVGSYSKKLIELCRSSCGVGAATKLLSERIMLLPPPRQEILISYYLKGDGNRYLKKANDSLMIRASTASRGLAFQLQEIFARAGVFANLNLRKGGEDMIQGRKITRKDQYIVEHTEAKKWSGVRKKGNQFLVPIKKILSHPFKGRVYNLGVKKDETYLVKGFAVHNCSAPVYSSQSLHSAIVEIVAKKASLVKYTTLQNWSRDVLNLVTKRAHAYEEATVSWVDFNGGSRLTRKYPSIYLLGPRAKADIISVAYAGPGQVQDTGGKAIHLAKDTTSKIISRSVSKGGGHTAYRGLLHIAKGANNVKSTVRCVRPDTIILGDNKSIAEYRVGDHAIGMLGANRVSKKYVNDFAGTMLRIKAVGLVPFDVTPEHPMFVSRSRTTYPRVVRNGKRAYTQRIIVGNPAWKPASDLVGKHSFANGDYVLMPRLKGNVDVKELDLTPFAKNIKGVHIMAAKGHASVFPLNPETARVLGLYAAEGYASQGKLRFALGADESELADIISNTFGNLGYSVKRYASDSENGMEVYVFAEVLSRAFSAWCGKGAPNKRIPDFILLHSDSSIADSFMDGYVRGDGTHTLNSVGKRNVTHAVTTSKLLAMQIQLLGARKGLFFRITNASRPDMIQGRRVRVHEKYDVRCTTEGNFHARVDEQFLYVPIRKIEKVKYKGPVLNLETSDHTYLLSNVVSHNCDALLVDERSTTATYPYMEIQEDDATVTHEASVGKVGEEQLFYLMSRGISEGDALSMVVNGFMEPFAKELPMTYAVEFNRLMSLEMTNAVG